MFFFASNGCASLVVPRTLITVTLDAFPAGIYFIEVALLDRVGERLQSLHPGAADSVKYIVPHSKRTFSIRSMFPKCSYRSVLYVLRTFDVVPILVLVLVLICVVTFFLHC